MFLSQRFLERVWDNAPIFGLVLLLSACAWLIGGLPGILIAYVGVYFVVSLGRRLSPRLVMALKGARPVLPSYHTELYVRLQSLAERAGLHTVPKLYFFRGAGANAYSGGGTDGSAIALSRSLLANLSSREILGVLAHEISHIANGDLRRIMLAEAIGRTASNISLVVVIANLIHALLTARVLVELGTLIFLATVPMMTSLLFLAYARRREFEADRRAVSLTGDPEGLASALMRLDALNNGWVWRFFRSARNTLEPSLLRTHPPTQKRIERILNLRHPNPSGGRPFAASLHPIRRPNYDERRHVMSTRRHITAVAGFMLILMSAVPAMGQLSGQPLPVGKDGGPTLAPLLKQATPAVVNIAVKAAAKEQNPLLRAPFFRFFFDNPQQQPQAQPQISAGSGVIIDRVKGYIKTNHHVIENADEIVVTLKDRRNFKAKLIGSDKGTDIALLQIKAENLTGLPFGDSDALDVGDFVLAVNRQQTPTPDSFSKAVEEADKVLAMNILRGGAQLFLVLQ